LEYPGIPYVVAISNQVFSRKEKRKSFRRLETVFATGTPINKGTPMMRTFDERNLGKRPPPFPHTPQKNLGRRVCVDRPGNFKDMSGKGTMTRTGGKNSLIQKLFEDLL